MLARAKGVAGLCIPLLASSLIPAAAQTGGKEYDEAAAEQARRYLEEGRDIFRFDTFGSEAFWGGRLQLHQAIAGEANGGVGPGISPKAALGLGLKVDVNAIPPEVAAALGRGEVDLDDPASTLVLLKANAVVGVTGFFGEDGKTLTGVGIQCALCHSTVDDAYAPGIGHRLDGWPNRDLDVGAIVASAPDLSAFADLLQVDEAEVKQVLDQLGARQVRRRAQSRRQGVPAGRQDGRDAQSAGLRPRRREQPHLDRRLGHGQLLERLCRQPRDARQGHLLRSAPRRRREVSGRGAHASRATSSDDEDRITAKLPALHFYQLVAADARSRRPAPSTAPPRQNGELLFNGKAQLRDLPRAADLHRAGLEPAHGRGDRHRRLPGHALAGRALPDDAAAGACGTPRRSTRAASTTTAASPRSTTSSTTTTTIFDLRPQRAGEDAT